jgi:hypothetical protein
MTQSTDQSRTCTGTSPAAPLALAPRPAPPLRPLTAVRTFAWPENGEADAPIELALGAYGNHTADRAFGQGTDGAA